MAPLLTADHGRVDPDVFEVDSSITNATWVRELVSDELGPEHAHDSEIQACAILRTEPIHAVALSLFLEALAEHCGADLLRLKGIVHIAQSTDRPAVIHGVQHVFHPLEWLPHWPSEDRRSRIVMIGRRLPQRWIELLLTGIQAEVQELIR